MQKLNLYKLLYLNEVTRTSPSDISLIEPIQIVVFKFMHQSCKPQRLSIEPIQIVVFKWALAFRVGKVKQIEPIQIVVFK